MSVQSEHINIESSECVSVTTYNQLRPTGSLLHHLFPHSLPLFLELPLCWRRTVLMYKGTHIICLDIMTTTAGKHIQYPKLHTVNQD